MLVNVRASNFYAFTTPVELSMKADMRHKRLSPNVHRLDERNILKVAGVFGQNNAGKTCLINIIKAVKKVILSAGEGIIMPNFFSNNPVCELGIDFIARERCFSYDFKLSVDGGEFIYERFAEKIVDKHGNEKEEVWLQINTLMEQYQCIDKKAEEILPIFSRHNILIHQVDTEKFEHLKEMKELLTSFAEKIDIIDLNNIPMKKTIENLKTKSEYKEKIVEFIKNADVDLDDYDYLEESNVTIELREQKPQENVLDIPESLVEQLRITSNYHGVHVPSLFFDSTGTKKIAAIASYIVEALENGRILVVDEIDSSLHFKLTRAIVAMFNNDLNDTAQLIFTSHDTNLLDVKKLFRKEQIWFVAKEKREVYVYSLAEFTAEDGVRDTSNIIEKYRRGALGALPEPDLLSILLEIKGNTAQEDSDAE